MVFATFRTLNEEVCYKVVLLGEQSASNPDAVGSNPTDLALPCERSRCGGLFVEQARRVRLPYRVLIIGPGTGRRGNRLIRGSRQVRLLPARFEG